MLAGSMNPSAGKADPYWYEWNVGLEKVVEMLHPDSGIASVEFQQNGMKGWDDVVVRFKAGAVHYYQVKHSRAGNNLTFGSLVQPEEGLSLLFSLFDAWKSLGKSRESARFIVHTNREAGSRSSTSDQGVKRPSLAEFITWLTKTLGAVSTVASIVPPADWAAAWQEWLSQLKGTDQEQYDFLSTLTFDTAQEDSPAMEERLIGMLQMSFATGRDQAFGLFKGLTNGLREWTTTRFDRPVGIEDVLQALALSKEAHEEEAAPPPPAPFFSSRQRFLADITAALESGPKVVFLCGEPGAGKTSLVSSLTMRRTEQSMAGLIGLRYFAYRPITVESPVIPADADKYVQPERLWYTLLSQLRRGLGGRLRQYRVPVRNELISWTEARNHVLRIADELGRELKRDFVVVVDGIDHAARASRYDAGASKGFFDSLPGPDELAAKSVRLLVAGQPPTAYPEYPHWLTGKRADVKRLDVGKLDDDDIRLLLNAVNAPLVAASGEAVVRLVRDETGANTLATVFAADEARHCSTLDEYRERLAARRLKDGLIQYYLGIWGHATGGKASAVLPLASLLFVARERINAKILAAAFPGLGLGELAWQQMLDALEPLLVSEADGHRVRHNDVRVFLHSVLEGASKPARQTAMGMIFDYYWKVAPNRLAAHRSALHLARESGRLAEWPRVHSMDWVFEAAAIGFTYNEMQEDCAVALEEAVELRDWDLMLQVACAAETLEAWEDRCMGGWYEEKLPPEREVSFLRSEGAVTPVEHWTVSELNEVLNDASSLMQSRADERARDLLVRWFGGMTLAQLAKAIPEVTDEHRLGANMQDARRDLFKRLGAGFRAVAAPAPEADMSNKEMTQWTFYFELGWADASSADSKAKDLEEAYAGRPLQFYGGMDKAIGNFARDAAWHLVKEALASTPKDRSHFTGSFMARATWRSLRAGVGVRDNPWLEVLGQATFGLEGVEEDRVLCALDVARALGWTKAGTETGAIGRNVYAAETGAVETDNARYFVAIYRAAAVLGRIASTLATKGAEVTGELVPPNEVRQVAEALWSEGMHGGMRRFEHCALAGDLATELVRQAVGLSAEHWRGLLEAAAAVPKFQLDSRRESLWELYRRTGQTGELKAWLERWLGEDGWLWHPDTGSRESTLDVLLPLAEELGEKEFAQKARERASWLRITYRGHKDHSFRSLYLWLKTLGEREPACWRDLGVMMQTLRQAAREAGCDNEHGTEMQELIGLLAYRSGPEDVRRLLLAEEDARDGEDRFYGLRNRTMNGAIEFVQGGGVLGEAEALAIWCLVLGWTRWHDAHTVNRLRHLRQWLLARTGSAAQRKALEEKLARISPGEVAREAEPEDNTHEPVSSRAPETRTGTDFLKEVQAGKTINATAALTVIKYLQLTRPADYDALVSCTLSHVGPASPYGATWYYDDQMGLASMQEIAGLVGDAPLWNLVVAANAGIGRGSAWLQSVTDNLFDVLLARASAQGPAALRTGIERLGDMHERWLRGGRKTETISAVKLPPAVATTTWADTVETSLDIVLGSHSAEVVASGLQATHAWITARPDRIESLFQRWSGDDWKTNWLLVLAERWAADHPAEVDRVKARLEEIARERVLHLRLQAWLVLRILAVSRGEDPPEFPENPNYVATTDVPLAVPPKELLETKGLRVGSSNFVDRFGAAESVLDRVERSMGCPLAAVKTRIAQAVLQLPEAQKPTTFPSYLHADGDVFCSLTEVGPVLSAAFEQKLADSPLSAAGVLKLAHGYLHGEDAWIVSESPRPNREADAWPGEKLLEPGYQVPTDRRTLEKICYQLAMQSEVPDDEIVVGAKVDVYRSQEDYEFQFWYEESTTERGVVSVAEPVTTINSRTFPWRTGKWFEQKRPQGRRPLVHFAGSLTLLHHAGVQIIPAELWSTLFRWSPRYSNPLEWLFAGKLVARFERVHGPLRQSRRGHFRQPLLSRWLVKKAAWQAITPKLATLRPVAVLSSFPSNAEY